MPALKKISRQYKFNENMDLWIPREANASVGAEVFFDLFDASGIDRNFLAEEIFDISLKTLMRYRKEGKSLKPREGEVVLKMACILEKGIQVFGTMGAFKSWMEKPAFGLRGSKPLHMMNTVTGLDLVEDELVRIEYGAPA